MKALLLSLALIPCLGAPALAADKLDPNPFTARLVAIKGEIYEQLNRDDDALTAYEEALDLNRSLLDELLKGDGR